MRHQTGGLQTAHVKTGENSSLRRDTVARISPEGPAEAPRGLPPTRPQQIPFPGNPSPGGSFPEVQSWRVHTQAGQGSIPILPCLLAGSPGPGNTALGWQEKPLPPFGSDKELIRNSRCAVPQNKHHGQRHAPWAAESRFLFLQQPHRTRSSPAPRPEEPAFPWHRRKSPPSPG